MTIKVLQEAHVTSPQPWQLNAPLCCSEANTESSYRDKFVNVMEPLALKRVAKSSFRLSFSLTHFLGFKVSEMVILAVLMSAFPANRRRGVSQINSPNVFMDLSTSTGNYGTFTEGICSARYTAIKMKNDTVAPKSIWTLMPHLQMNECHCIQNVKPSVICAARTFLRNNFRTKPSLQQLNV